MMELLSPAGGRERLEYAIAYGADAVYMAGSGYSLRAFADNFTDSELSDAIKYAHIFGKKVYITTNIYAHNSDIDSMADYIRRLTELGADALLVADMGVLALAKKTVPHMPIHISTQANITNHMAAQMMYDLGASRVVLARELSIDEIADIHARVPKLELEAFVHGAACISYSGRCLLSNYLTDRGANQGKCVQACRWKYEIREVSREEWLPIAEDERGTYILNSKDLCMIEHLDKLSAAGVSSFKIEGRMKTAYYAATVTNAYRRAIDDMLAGKPYDPALYDELGKAANREFTTGFYFGKPENAQRYHSSKCTQSYDFVAVVQKSENGVLTVEQRNKFSVGDTLEVLSPDKSRHGKTFTVQSITNRYGQDVPSAPNPQEIVTLPCDLDLRFRDILRRRSI
ncbi:MAG: U32 family peptidase C-terminal domain-containing protein [Clostridia bacterium]|nr:U32 family peptidase C-terminal domain-containing protein [Clostridia bacterium]